MEIGLAAAVFHRGLNWKKLRGGPVDLRKRVGELLEVAIDCVRINKFPKGSRYKLITNYLQLGQAESCAEVEADLDMGT